MDEALDHRGGDLERRVAEACPDGIHVFFEAGKIVNHVDVLDGLERAPAGLQRPCAGENLGKQLIRFLD